MLTTLVAHPVGWGWGWGPGPWFLLFPLFWFTLIALFFAFGARRHRRWDAEQRGLYSERRGTGGARAVLAERFARGEIDESEYRARLEVLLASDAPST
ncbi:SHOCT domain-containing protein [Cellulomonas sp.]|uniref:SHOCT domain-containing protein n=1 Tax=Cellulomonas sp. TaxID=40001 RepID=UPI001B0A17D1|nr:SHOCT domain-containing protein [Cellulomonas sp.]MBO9556363.1 SHOCT domain-containing protein [Cellulomonas sp.]